MPYKIPIFLDRLSTIYSWSKFIKNQDFKMLHLINVKKFKIEIGIEGIFVMTSKWLASFGINKPKRNVMSCYWDSHIFECWGNICFLQIVIISNFWVIFCKKWLWTGLISESFFTLAPSPKKCAKSLSWAYFLEDKIDSDSAHFFWDLTEIKPTLFHSFLQTKRIVMYLLHYS